MRSRRGRGAGWTVRLAAAGVATLLWSSPSPATAAADPSPTPAQTPTIELDSQTKWVSESEDFLIRFRAGPAPPDARVRLVVYERLESRSDFTDTLSAELGDDIATRPDQALAELERDPLGIMQLNYPVGENGAGLDSTTGYGVYPVELVISDAGGESLAEIVTYLLLLPDPALGWPPLSVAAVMEVGTSPGLQPDGNVQLDTDEEAELRDRVEILGATRQVPLAVAPTPETLDALAQLDAADDETLIDLRPALQDRQVLATPYVPLDLDALAAAQLTDQVPAGVQAGTATVNRHLGVNPTAGIWLAGSTIGETESASLPGLGFGRAIVPSSAVAAVPEREDVTVQEGPARLGEAGPEALVDDDVLAQRLAGTEGMLDVQRFLAELATIWSTEPATQRGVVVRIPALATLDRRVVTEALIGLTEAPPGNRIVDAVQVGEMFDQLVPQGEEGPPVAELAPDGPSADLNGLHAPLQDAQTVVGGLAAMLNDTNLIRSLYRSLLIAPGAETPDSRRLDYVARVDDTEAELVGAIHAPDGFRITFTARDGTMPVNVYNDSQQEVEVRVHLSSSQLEFPDGSDFQLVVPPGGQRIDVPVRTRGSGAFPLGVRITSPDNKIVLDRETFTIRSTAISGVGLVLSIGAGLFLLIWWARHWRTARRSSRLVPQHAAERAAHERTLSGRGS